jgi:hypothetical protein
MHTHSLSHTLKIIHRKGAEYTPHYDWGADGKVSSRFISSLLYLNTVPKGGGTSFPKAVMG